MRGHRMTQKSVKYITCLLNMLNRLINDKKNNQLFRKKKTFFLIYFSNSNYISNENS